jgi:hypothetical protein
MVVGAVGRHLAVESLEELGRAVARVENPGRPPVSVKDAGDEHQPANEVRTAHRNQ